MSNPKFLDKGASFPIPFGWFPVFESEDLGIGAVSPLFSFGKELALWRDDSGSPHLVDAYCPHLGAHLGHGNVDGDCIVCPFHGWRFDPVGACERVPYSTHINANARLKTYPTREHDGQIIAWYHPNHLGPKWDFPTLNEWSTDRLCARSSYKQTINTSWQELSENGLDTAHFAVVHGSHDVVLHEVDEDGPFRIRRQTQMIPTPTGPALANSISQEFGPGLSYVRMTIDMEGLSEFVLYLTFGNTPIDSCRLEMRVSLHLSKGDGRENRLTRLMGRFLLRDLRRQLRQDIEILENKAFLPTPHLVRGDGPIMRHRHWARQFYSNSGI